MVPVSDISSDFASASEQLKRALSGGAAVSTPFSKVSLVLDGNSYTMLIKAKCKQFARTTLYLDTDYVLKSRLNDLIWQC